MVGLFDEMDKNEIKHAGKEAPKSKISKPIVRLGKTEERPNKYWNVENHGNITNNLMGLGSCEISMRKSVDRFTAPKMTASSVENVVFHGIVGGSDRADVLLFTLVLSFFHLGWRAL